MKDEVLRENLLELLDMGSAHVTFEEALNGLDGRNAFRRPAGAAVDEKADLRSAWELLEHMRITQEDILRYTMDPSWRSPPWPGGYWPLPPSADAPPAAERIRLWDATLDAFRNDLEEVRGWVQDKGLDLTAGIPHGEGRTYLRQVLLVADHNAYHLGQIVSVRRLLGLWP